MIPTECGLGLGSSAGIAHIAVNADPALAAPVVAAALQKLKTGKRRRQLCARV